MTEDLLSNHRPPMPDAVAPRARRKLQLSTTISLVVLFALAVIAVSIGIAQAETLGTMVDDETGRLALFGLICAIVMTGGVTAIGMWLTAPSAAYEGARKGLPALGRTSATSF
jgi:hypothetical protein